MLSVTQFFECYILKEIRSKLKIMSKDLCKFTGIAIEKLKSLVREIIQNIF